MRFVLIFFGFGIFLNTDNTQKHNIDFISFEHIGESDKPIKFIVSYDEISTDSLLNYNSIIKVDKDIFDLAFSCAIKFNTSLQNVDKKEFGVFSIVLCKNGVITKYLTPSRENSIEYFRMMKIKLEREIRASALVNEFEKIINRLG